MRASELPTARGASTREGDPSRRVVGAPLVLGRYRLHRRLGAGAYGTVWLAHDERLDRQVAVKIVARELVVGGRFEREARAAARLAHPGIVTLYEAGTDDEGAYLVSELVRGPTFAALLADGRLSDRDIVEIGIALCDALTHAHSQGIVHRDVKPSNVLVDEQPSTPAEVAKLTDFGVARVVGSDSLTQTGDVIGTAAYMAPEQAQGREAGAPADLYSLALVLYEALTGTNPVRTGTAAQRARRLGAHLPPLRRQRRDLPRELGHGIDLALRPAPRERGTVENLREALTASLTAVTDDPGIVTSSWPARAEPRRDSWPPSPFPAPSAKTATEATADPPPRAARPPIPLPARVLAALATAALVAWLVAHLLHGSPAAAPPLALGVAALVALLPRLGWMAAAAGVVASLILAGSTGVALVLGLAALMPLVVLPFACAAWSLPAGAPGLGALGLAGAWPALAARAGSAWRRAALGASGWIWLLVAERLTGTRLYSGSAPAMPAPAAWASAPQRAIHDVLGPILSSGALAPAVVWGVAAMVLPWLVRGRTPALDVVRVVIWSALLVSATSATIGLMPGVAQRAAPRGAALGALVGVAFALVPTAIGLRRGSRESRAARTGLP